MKVKFTRDYTVKNEEAAHYEKGKTYEMNDASAKHFINRRAAEKVMSGSVSEPSTLPVSEPEPRNKRK